MSKRNQSKTNTWLGIVVAVALVVAYLAGWWPFDGSVQGSDESHAPDGQAAQEAQQGEEWFVVRVIDGDTIVVERGARQETVRMIGIDAPERDTCGYWEARDALTDWVDQRVVTLVPGAPTDRDVHNRLLRYVETDGEDVGLGLIEDGVVVARYDSRTNQDHDREASYWEADDASPNFCN